MWWIYLKYFYEPYFFKSNSRSLGANGDALPILLLSLFSLGFCRKYQHPWLQPGCRQLLLPGKERNHALLLQRRCLQQPQQNPLSAPRSTVTEKPHRRLWLQVWPLTFFSCLSNYYYNWRSLKNRAWHPVFVHPPCPPDTFLSALFGVSL